MPRFLTDPDVTGVEKLSIWPPTESWFEEAYAPLPHLDASGEGLGWQPKEIQYPHTPFFVVQAFVQETCFRPSAYPISRGGAGLWLVCFAVRVSGPLGLTWLMLPTPSRPVVFSNSSRLSSTQ